MNMTLQRTKEDLSTTMKLRSGFAGELNCPLHNNPKELNTSVRDDAN